MLLVTPDLYYHHQTGRKLFDLLTLEFRRPLRNCGTLQHHIPLGGGFDMCAYSISRKCQLFLFPHVAQLKEAEMSFEEHDGDLWVLLITSRQPVANNLTHFCIH